MLDLNIEDILSTERMFDQNKLDVRTVTMGISLLGCISDDEKMLCTKIYDTICRKAEHLTSVSHDISREYGVGSNGACRYHECICRNLQFVHLVCE